MELLHSNCAPKSGITVAIVAVPMEPSMHWTLY